jgi:drug/metabolite transporter (DMT)-like permease
VGLGVVRTVRDRHWRAPIMTRSEWFWYLLAILLGGVLGLLLLMLGLMHTSASSASLLLNLEAVLTALIAWILFRENANRLVVFGMALIVAGAVLLAWPAGQGRGQFGWGVWLIALACLCWALDNNFTRKVSNSDALFIAGLKGIVAGPVNTSIALMLGSRLPPAATITEAMTLGVWRTASAWCCSFWACANLAQRAPAHIFPPRRSWARRSRSLHLVTKSRRRSGWRPP